MEPPLAYRYQQALDRFRRDAEPAPLLRRYSELVSLLDLTSGLSAGLTSDQLLEAALLVVLGELQSVRGALLVRLAGDTYEVRAARGLAAGAPRRVTLAGLDAVVEPVAAEGEPAVAALGLEWLCAVRKGPRAIAAIGVGRRHDGRAPDVDDLGFLASLASCAATPIDNGLILEELRRVNQKLSLKVFQLHSLFDVSRELTASLDAATVESVTLSTLMGQLLVSRGALYRLTEDGHVAAEERGFRVEAPPLVPADVEPALAVLERPLASSALPDGALRGRLDEARLVYVAPLGLARQARGLVALGERAGGGVFGEEEEDLVMTLGGQAAAALQAVRLQRVRLEKERQDRELQIARGIQRSLFPATLPSVAGYDVAAACHTSQEVGGDHYDVATLPDGRVALAIADVSGKGTPASLLMASLHGSLRALMGTAPPARLAARLNELLLESTQPSRYVTLVYAELEPANGRFAYVNCGHVPPFVSGAGGVLRRLTAGGPPLGLLPNARYDSEVVTLAPGQRLTCVTDGVTEALDAGEREFGDARAAAEVACGGAAAAAVDRLWQAVLAWTGGRGPSDDLTILTLRRDER